VSDAASDVEEAPDSGQTAADTDEHARSEETSEYGEPNPPEREDFKQPPGVVACDGPGDGGVEKEL